jgi:hypothetical protein
VLLCVVLDAPRQASSLLVLDARTLDEVARADLPHPVLFGYHGLFVPDAPGAAAPPGSDAPDPGRGATPPGRSPAAP